MKMSKHTPGPWHFVPENTGLMPDHGYGILYGEPDYWGWEKNLYVSVGCSNNVLRELGEGAAEANARLIAAAPDLLAALERMVTDYGDVPDSSDADGQSVIAAARAAIAKATHPSHGSTLEE
jgi:hypothetical protein